VQCQQCGGIDHTTFECTMTTPALMDFLREFRGRTTEPVTTESEDGNDEWSVPAGDWRPSPERVLGLADLVVGSDAGGRSGVDSFVGPAELEAAAGKPVSGEWAPADGSWAPPALWPTEAGEAVETVEAGAKSSVPGQPAVPARDDAREIQGSWHLLSLVPGKVLLTLAATILSLVVIALIAVH
jgi:hypothetical protein